MLAAIDWQSFLLGIAATIILIGGVLGALGQIGHAWGWVMQRVRPAWPNLELESAGGTHSTERDEATGEITWINVRPAFAVRNNEPVSVYAVSGGIVHPDGGERVAHPQRISVLKAETQVVLDATDSFQIPPHWLAGFTGHNPLAAVPYFVELVDADKRRWEGVIDFRDEVPQLRFHRVKR